MNFKTRNTLKSKAYDESKKFWEGSFFKYSKSEIFENNIEGKTSHVEVVIETSLILKINEKCNSNKTAIFAYLTSCINILLHKYTQNEYVQIGFPKFLEENYLLDSKDIILNSVYDSATSFIQFLNESVERLEMCIQNEHYPINHLVSENKHINKLDDLFELFFIYEDFYTNEDTILEYPISLIYSNKKRCLQLISLLKEENKIIGINFLNHLVFIIEQTLNDDKIKLNDIILFSEKEKDLIVKSLTNETEYPKNSSVIKIFTEQALLTPDRIAIVFNDHQLTYQELNEASNKFAHFLKGKYDLEIKDIVAIELQQGDALLISILAILKLRCSYVPLSGNLPDERRSAIINETSCKLFINLDVYSQFQSIKNEISPLPIVNSLQIESNDLVYIMYTSGSTGNPKGVMVNHQNIIRLVKSDNYVCLTGDEIILSTGDISFDATTFEYWGALLNGGTLVLCDQNTLLNTRKLTSLIISTGADLMFLTSGLFNELITNSIHVFSGLKTLLTGGDIISKRHVSKLMKAYRNLDVFHVYGPTENTTFSTFHKIQFGDEVMPIGKPISNSSAYILGNWKELCPIGIMGEIYLGGDGISMGYFKQPELTCTAFVESPFKTGDILYKTGDLGYLLPDGNLQITGRKDNQVKLRGFRIELDGIKAKLLEFDIIENAELIVSSKESHEKKIIAFVVLKNNEDISEIKNKLKFLLPDYMIPSQFIEIDKIPLTINNKTNYKALKEKYSQLKIVDGPSKLTTSTENRLALVWSKVLGVASIGRNDNFFELGGHSLKAIELIVQIEEEFKVELSIEVIFAGLELWEIALIIDKEEEKGLQIKKSLQLLVSESKYYSPSPQQKRLWLISQNNNGSKAYNMPTLFTLKGDLNENYFVESFYIVLKKHESLRSVFEQIKGEPRIKILPFEKVQACIRFVDLSDDIQKEEKITHLIDENSNYLFDLEKGPLLKLSLIKKKESDYLLLFNIHHTIFDGVSFQILFNELSFSYEKLLKGLPIQLQENTFQYRDYVHWISNNLREDSKSFWLEHLSDYTPFQIPRDIKNNKKTYKGKVYSTIIDLEISQKLRAFSKEEKNTLFTILLATFNLLIYKFFQIDNFVVSTVVSDRNKPEFKDQIGFFVNTIPIRCKKVSETDSFRSYLSGVKESIINSITHSKYPVDQLIEELDLNNKMENSQLFDIMFSLYVDDFSETNFSGIEIQTIKSESNTSKFDLLAYFVDDNSTEIQLDIEYNSDLFFESSISSLFNPFSQILASIVSDIDQCLNEINYISESEEKLLHSYNSNIEVFYEKDITIVSLFEDQVVRTPDAVAVVFEGVELTYRELNEKSNQLASHLRKKGVKEETLVAVCLNHSLDLIISILGILKSGGAYLPIDPSYPSERIIYSLENSAVSYIISSVENLPQYIIKHTVLIDQDWNTINKEPKSKVSSNLEASNLAYVIYTSGSTGKPKGVLITHQNVVRLFNTESPLFDFDNQDVWTMFHSFCFDFSVWEMYGALLNGGRLVIISRELAKDPLNFIKILEESKVTVLNLTPTAFSILEKFIFLSDLRLNVRYLIFGGELLNPEILRLWKDKYPNCKLINMYGITETTVHVTYKEITEIEIHNNVSVIGKPIPTLGCYVLDEKMNLVPRGFFGELYVSGAGVSRGYLNADDLTKERFLNNPFDIEGGKIYKTGDIVKWNPQGDLVYKGRNDDQVKIRGYRIELGEIANVLNNFHAIEKAVVILADMDAAEKYLVAYFIPNIDLAYTVRKYLEHKNKNIIPQNIKLYKLPNGVSMYTYNKAELDFLNKEIFEDNLYFKHGIQIPENACIFDVGANIGAFSIYSGLIAKKVNIYSFEPLSPTFEVLKLNADLYKADIKVFNYGLSNKEELVNFTHYPNASVLSNRYSNEEYVKKNVKDFFNNSVDIDETYGVEYLLDNRLLTEKHECQLRTLSSVLKENNIKKIDLLKIDVEGAELDVLEGIFEEDWNKIDQIVLEVQDDTNNKLIKIQELLKSKKFKVYTEQDDNLNNTSLHNVYALATDFLNHKEEPSATELGLQGEYYHTETLNSNLVEFLKEKLPDYMIPSYFVPVSNFPMTSNGKLDIKALGVQEHNLLENNEVYVAPRNKMEEQLLKIWKSILNKEKIGVRDDFFELGGQSFKLANLILKINQEIGINFLFKDVIENSTIESLSNKIMLFESKIDDYSQIISDKENENVPFPLTDVQLAYLWGRQEAFEMGGGSTHGYAEMEFGNEIHFENFQKAINRLIKRHPMLRTIFNYNGTQQIIDKVPCYFVDYKDFSLFSDSEQTKHIEAIRNEMTNHTFELDKFPLFEIKIAKLNTGYYKIFYEIDPIISDMMSTLIINNEFYKLYNEPKLELPELKINFRDYILKLKELESSELYERDREFWTEKIPTFSESPNFEFKELPANVKKPTFKRKFKLIQETVWDSIIVQCNKRKITPTALLSTIYMEVLAKWCNQPRVSINLTVANRFPFHPEVNQIVGDFTSIIILEGDLSLKKNIWEKAEVVQSDLWEALDHKHYDGIKFIREFSKYHNLGKQTVFPYVFTSALSLDNIFTNEIENELDENYQHSITQTSQVFIDSKAVLLGKKLLVEWDYVSELFSNKKIDSMFNDYVHLINEVGVDIDKCKLNSKTELNNLVNKYNNTYWDNPPTTLAEIVQKSTTLYPHNIAVRSGKDELTYLELELLSNQVANYLISKDVKSGDIIGIIGDRTTVSIAYLYGILKTGSVFVPIDEIYPEKRKQYILEDSKSKLCLSKNNYDEIKTHSTLYDNSMNLSSPFDPAYIIYTSGSTGNPKGVLIKNESVCNTILDVNNKFGVNESDKLIGLSSLSFDLSIYDIFGCLQAGATLIMISDQRDAMAVIEIVKKEGITIWNSVPAIMINTLERFNLLQGDILPSLRLAILSGDWIPIGLPEKIKKIFPNVDLISMGGATEASIWSIYFRIDTINEEWKTIPYGFPLANQTIYVLDYGMEPCPIGTKGDIYIGGVGVACQYVNNERQTQNSFIENSLYGKIYKTGDKGKFTSEGFVEFLGRDDEQVKINGYRIEIGEIENVISKIVGISRVKVLARQINDFQREIVCFFQKKSNKINEDFIRELLLTTLPEYMIPKHFFDLIEFPMTENGKIDVKHLINDVNISLKHDKEIVCATTDEEIILSGILQNLLYHNSLLDIHLSFFSLGANSLLLTRLINEIEMNFNIKLNFKDVLENDTISKLASHINKLKGVSDIDDLFNEIEKL